MVENHFANTYREIEIFQGNNVRKSIRYLALEFLSRWQRVINYNTPFHTPRIQFLYVHHVFKDEEIAFRKLLNFLQREHTFISYSEAVLRIKTGNIDKPYISISSDDGFKNNLNAARICNELGISACFFINPGLINENNYHKIKQHCNNKLQFLPVEFLTWDDVGTLKSNGHEIGSHTMFHDNVTHMSIEKFRIDCNQSRSLLMKHCGSADHFSFPYGRYADFSAMAFKTVFDEGFESCASAERGCHLPSAPVSAKEVCIRRDHILPSWPLSHVGYFLLNNIKKASGVDRGFLYRYGD